MSSGELPAASPSSGLALLSAKGKQALDTRRETPLGSVITRRACQVSLAPRIWDAQCPPPPPAWQQSDPLASQVPRPSSGDSHTGVTLDVPVGLSTCHVSLGAARRRSRTPHSLRSPQGGNEQDG